MKNFICQSKLEINDKCEIQCKHCKEYFGELEEQIKLDSDKFCNCGNDRDIGNAIDEDGIKYCLHCGYTLI